MLYVTSGLPGTGKSTLARQLAPHLRAAYLRVDTVEAALLRFGIQASVEGYAVSYAVALDNLRLGTAVVVDVVNPLAVTRGAWAGVAAEAGTPLVNIEVVCSNPAEHRRRVEVRHDDPANRAGEWTPPTWASVQAFAQEFEPWQGERVVVDTAGRTAEEAFTALRAALGV
ncbi:putative kinase [Deinococcus metalli]|uniref:Adenylyl-sulfate kinase n=1 Tax=Deinococcus metalli TaxID=1141878 RepID=A0A7W8NSR4_9DEIO|nr:AAA family ATPase [Deinococcus metalli]MBB5377437.1 putative kinase [Deinococcus metalli]GHF50404.1 adenylyl-sulfate kinase [Deinococcus metalli]